MYHGYEYVAHDYFASYAWLAFEGILALIFIYIKYKAAKAKEDKKAAELSDSAAPVAKSYRPSAAARKVNSPKDSTQSAMPPELDHFAGF